MLVLPLPGVSAERVLQVLGEQAALLSQADSDTGDRLNAYIRWANDAAVSLASVAAARSVDQLVLTRRYWALQSATASKSMYKLLQVEFDDRARAFDSALGDLRREIDRWTRPGVFVLPDASFYIRHSDKLEHVDFRPLRGIWEEPVHVLVPIAIVDELDRLKESTNKRARWRARYTLAVLDDRLKNPNTPGQLRPEDFTAIDQGTGGIPSGAITVEIVFDPPEHVRLPIVDDEIIDRALMVQVYAGRAITVVTYDTGQSTRARRVGLPTKKLLDPPEGDEPPVR